VNQDIQNRIQEAVDLLCGGNKSEFCRRIGRPAQAIKDIIGGKQSYPGFELLYDILSSDLGISPNWLMLGDGPMVETEGVRSEPKSLNMNEFERLDYLIKVLSGDNARMFADKAGIRPDSLSRVRNGRGNPSFYFERILDAFPDVEREWLYTGVGEPMKEGREKGEILSKLESLEREVGRLADLVEKMASYQESANGR